MKAWILGVLLPLLSLLPYCPVGRSVSEGITRRVLNGSVPSALPLLDGNTSRSTAVTNNSTQLPSSLPTAPTPTPKWSKDSKVNIFDECVLMKSNTSYSRRVMESYLELGYYDIMHEVDISFDVLPDRYSHNGPLFSIGTQDFQYYEWKTKAFETQYFVVEFVYSAMSMLLKALMEPHMKPMEICRTYPHPYDISDGQWHHIRAQRLSRGIENDVWYLTLDDMTINNTVNSENDVQLQDRPAYLGGRPGFRSYQFRGVIKNFKVRGERVPLRGRATYGLVEVWHCSAPEVAKFVESIQAPAQQNRIRDMGRPRRPPTPD